MTIEPLQQFHKALYLDPTTGSVAFQAAIGGLLAATATLRLYWGRVSKLLERMRRGRNG